MKHASDLINHLRRSPSASKLAEHEGYARLAAMLPLKFRQAVLFMYQKQQTLFFVLNHPGMHMEFNYNLSLIKSLLSTLQRATGLLADITEVRCFVSHRAELLFAPPPQSSTEPHYAEHAFGEFENLATDPDLAALFESIRATVCNP